MVSITSCNHALCSQMQKTVNIPRKHVVFIHFSMFWKFSFSVTLLTYMVLYCFVYVVAMCLFRSQSWDSSVRILHGSFGVIVMTTPMNGSAVPIKRFRKLYDRVKNNDKSIYCCHVDFFFQRNTCIFFCTLWFIKNIYFQIQLILSYDFQKHMYSFSKHNCITLFEDFAICFLEIHAFIFCRS